MTTVSTTEPTLISALWPVRAATAALRWIVLMIVGSALLAVCSQIAVPLQPVPITMQTFAVLVIAMAYGWRLGAATVALYLAEGAVGLPVFAEFSGGPATLFGPTGGYLLGFVLAAAIVGYLGERGWDRDIPRTALAMLAGNIALYVPGLFWLSGFVDGFENAITYGLMPFLGGDLLKLALAAFLMPLAWRLVGRPRV
jgi:biotin transport system substrate-specific component